MSVSVPPAMRGPGSVMRATLPGVMSDPPRRKRVRTNGSGAEDRDFVARMQAGDADAFGVVYEKYAGRIHAFALRRLRDRTEAEDLCQDVFVEVARSIRGFEGRSRLSTWIFGIACHEIADRRSKHQREGGSISAANLALASREAPVDDQVDSARMLARCRDVLEREIGATHREIFQLHLGGAADMASIAAAVGKSRQAVKVSVFRTRKHLAGRVAGLRELIARS